MLTEARDDAVTIAPRHMFSVILSLAKAGHSQHVPQVSRVMNGVISVVLCIKTNKSSILFLQLLISGEFATVLLSRNIRYYFITVVIAYNVCIYGSVLCRMS